MGLVADIYISYFFKILVRWLRFRHSAQWPRADATVTAAPSSTSGAWGCPVAEIPYAYRVGGELYTGLHEEPFLLSDSAKNYAERFGRDATLVVRIEPGRPEISILLPQDQIQASNGAVLTAI